jgi:hypothetical protein
MRSTADASQVGLSHSTQPRSPCSMVSESKGRLAGFMKSLSGWSSFAKAYENHCLTKIVCGGFVKSNSCSRPIHLYTFDLAKTGLTRHALGASLK